MRRRKNHLDLLEGSSFVVVLVLDVDVLHTPMEDWVFGALESSQIVLVEHGWYFVVVKLL